MRTPNDLKNMRKLCAALGNPEHGLRFVHVAGTNGKGSVCRYVYEALRALGYSSGLFTSPHLLSECERIELDGEMIAASELAALCARVDEAASKLGDLRPYAQLSEFERLTAAVLLYFAEKRPDFVVLEAGLGGMRDATNVIEAPLVSVITNVGLDHTERLGHSIAAIAREKAGIIKRGCAVVSGAVGEAAKIIAAVADERQAPLVSAKDSHYKISEMSLAGCRFDAWLGGGGASGGNGNSGGNSGGSDGGHNYPDLEISMLGEHQVQNTVLALQVLDVLRQSGHISPKLWRCEQLYRGFKNAKLPARLELISREPLMIVDGAHNPDGAKVLVKALDALLPGGKFLFVCAIQSDKAAEQMLRTFSTLTGDFIATSIDYDRALSAEALGQALRAAGGALLCAANSPAQAYAAAVAKSQNYDATVFTGSLYFAADILAVDRQSFEA